MGDRRLDLDAVDRSAGSITMEIVGGSYRGYSSRKGASEYFIGSTSYGLRGRSEGEEALVDGSGAVEDAGTFVEECQTGACALGKFELEAVKGVDDQLAVDVVVA